MVQRDPEQTVVYQVVQEHLADFLAAAEQDGPGLPGYVRAELLAYLDCGVLGRSGAACLVCDTCQQRVFLPFSCKRRRFCPSCCGRRMSEVAAHVVTHVLPDQPVRQWVLSLPVWLRFVMLRQRELVAPVLGIVVRVISGWLMARVRERGKRSGPMQAGLLAVEQRFADGAKLNWHLHVLALDGVYCQGEGAAAAEFVRVQAPGREELAELVVKIRNRVLRLLRKRGLLPEESGEQLVLGGDDGPLANWQQAALAGRVATGPRAGWRIQRVGSEVVYVPLTQTVSMRLPWPSLASGQPASAYSQYICVLWPTWT